MTGLITVQNTAGTCTMPTTTAKRQIFTTTEYTVPTSLPDWAINLAGQTGNATSTGCTYSLQDDTLDPFQWYSLSYGGTASTVNAWKWIGEYSEWKMSLREKIARLDPKDRLRQIIQSRCAPAIIGVRKPLVLSINEREMRARAMLCRLIGDDRFRRYVAHGHVSLRAKSGRVYQIFPGHGITKVYLLGVPVEKLCVVLIGDFPATDSVVMRYLLILNDEDDFRRRANVSPLNRVANASPIIQPRPLADIFADLRKGIRV